MRGISADERVGRVRRMRVAGLVLAGSLAVSGAVGHAQLASRDGSNATSKAMATHRTRLMLKDGSYQVVMSWKVTGQRVQFVSAERGGETEEIPLDLVDVDATKRWAAGHPALDPDAVAEGRVKAPPPVLDPELAREEAERAALTPEVAPHLRLVFEDSVLALDTFHDTPELVPLEQAQGDLNRETGHSVLRGLIRPGSAAHQMLLLKGEKADVQMHEAQPAFYIRTGEDAPEEGEAMTVDTHGASSSPAVKEKKQTAPSRYAIVRVEVRQDARMVASFDTSADGSGSRETGRRGAGQEDVVDTLSTELAGGHWLKLTPREPLLFGEYCLVEILGDNQVNLGVWDFGVHPTAPENRDVLRPDLRTPELDRRGRE